MELYNNKNGGTESSSQKFGNTLGSLQEEQSGFDSSNRMICAQVLNIKGLFVLQGIKE